MQTTLNVKGMTCEHCESAVKGALENLQGVQSAEVHLDTGKVDVVYDDAAVTIAAMNEEVEDQGYDVVTPS